MPWVWKSITIPAGTDEQSPAEEEVELHSPDVKGLAVVIEATTNAKEAGVRVETPDQRMFPDAADGADQFIYSMPVQVSIVLDEEIRIGPKSPARVSIFGFNEDAAAITAQIGIRLDPFKSPVERIEQRVREYIEATKRLSSQPDIEKQIRRVAGFIAGFFGVQQDDES